MALMSSQLPGPPLLSSKGARQPATRFTLKVFMLPLMRLFVGLLMALNISLDLSPWPFCTRSMSSLVKLLPGCGVSPGSDGFTPLGGPTLTGGLALTIGIGLHVYSPFS